MRRKALAGLMAGLWLMPCWSAAAKAAKKDAPKAATFSKQIPPDQRIQQALNRLTFGPRPGDAERVRSVGLKKWIDLQLHPARIPANPVLEAKLKTLDTLSMTGAELVTNYPSPQVARLMVSGQLPFPTDPDRRMTIQKIVARLNRAQGQATQTPPVPADLFTPEQLRALRTGTPQQRLAFFGALPPEKQEQVIEALPGVRQALYDSAPPELRRRIELSAGPAQVVARDLMESKMLRAIYSDRQLEEVLADFWFNHFNVYLDKGADHYMVTEYERDVIRPHVLGKFKDLLEATAKSPAMLFYLDNWQSVGPNVSQARAANQVRRGLNENYGRELLELHTLGVDGGYTQKDVTEVARCFTGWTILQPQRGGDFVFNPRAHDNGEKGGLGVANDPRRRRHEGRRKSVGYRGAPSFHRAFHIEGTRPALRGGRSARRAGEPHGPDVSQDRWRPVRSHENHAGLERIPERGRVPHQDEVAVRVGGERRARRGWPGGLRRELGQPGRSAWRAALPQAGADGLLQFGQGVGEYGGPAGAHEFRAAVGGQPGTRREGRRREH